MPGEFGNTDVPKIAVQALDVIYQASTFKGVIGDTIPTEPVDTLTLKFDVTVGVDGDYDVQPDADTDLKRLAYTQLTANLIWSKYKFMVTDSSKLYSRETKRAWNDSIKAATEYFAAVKDYQVLTVLSAGAASSAASSGGNWDTSTAEIEDDIVAGLQAIGGSSNMQTGDVISTIAPADVYYEMRKLDLIGNVQQQLLTYLQGSFDLQIRSFRPRNAGGTATLDALEDDCIMYVNGRQTARHAQYSRAAATARGFPLTERWREPDRGEAYYMRMASISRAVWDAVNTTNTKSNRIYKITDVT